MLCWRASRAYAREDSAQQFFRLADSCREVLEEGRAARAVRDAMVAHKIVLVPGAVSKLEAVWTPAKAKHSAEEVAA